MRYCLIIWLSHDSAHCEDEDIESTTKAAPCGRL